MHRVNWSVTYINSFISCCTSTFIRSLWDCSKFGNVRFCEGLESTYHKIIITNIVCNWKVSSSKIAVKSSTIVHIIYTSRIHINIRYRRRQCITNSNWSSFKSWGYIKSTIIIRRIIVFISSLNYYCSYCFFNTQVIWNMNIQWRGRNKASITNQSCVCITINNFWVIPWISNPCTVIVALINVSRCPISWKWSGWKNMIYWRRLVMPKSTWFLYQYLKTQKNKNSNVLFILLFQK